MMRWIFFICSLQFYLENVYSQESGHKEIFQKVQSLFNSKCITCHNSEDLAAGMSLESGMSYRSLVNVASGEDPTLKRIEPNNPEASYLYRKIMRDAANLPFKEEGMPLDDDKLSDEEIGIIRDWIRSFPKEIWGESKPMSSHVTSTADDLSDNFLATQLIALPTPMCLAQKRPNSEFCIALVGSTAAGAGTIRWVVFSGWITEP